MLLKSEKTDHDRFGELAALAAIGQVTAEEYQELNAHLELCASCREECRDFSELPLKGSQSRRRFRRTGGSDRIGWKKFGNRGSQCRFMYTPESLFCACRAECLPQRSIAMQAVIAFKWNDLRTWTRRTPGFVIKLNSSPPGQTRNRGAKIPVFPPTVLPGR